MSNEELLIGKWQPIQDCDLIDGQWHIYNSYRENESYYLFENEHFTTCGAGYYEDNVAYPYHYNAENDLIQLEQETIKVIQISKAHLLIEIAVDPIHPDERVRVLLRRDMEE